jgi:hypothetical protein
MAKLGRFIDTPGDAPPNLSWGSVMIDHLEGEQRFVRVLDSDAWDVDGKLLKRRAKVLSHPPEPKVLREDNPGNRQEFLGLDRTWSSTASPRAWFPSLSVLPADFAKQADRSLSVNNEFIARIDENIALVRGKPLPEVKSLPFWFALLAWEPRIKESSLVGACSKCLCRRPRGEDRARKNVCTVVSSRGRKGMAANVRLR